jgi:uncharacterized protein (DUF885 family)
MLTRRTLLQTSIAASATASVPWVAHTATPSADPALTALFGTLFQEDLQAQPERATLLAQDHGANAGLRAQLSDGSPAGLARQRALTASQIKRLEAVDAARLTGDDRVNYDVVLYIRRASAAAQAFDYGSGRAPYLLSQQDGSYQDIPQFLDTKHPIGDAADADAYLARLGAWGRMLDDETAQLRHDAGIGVVPPDFVLAKTLGGIDAVRRPVGEALVVQSIARRAKAKGLPDHYAADAARLYSEAVLPALGRQRDAVAALQSKAVHDAGVWHLPQGEAFYAMALKGTTTSSLSPDEVHRFGLDQARMLSARIDAIMLKHGLGTSGTTGQRLAALFRRPDQLYPDTDAGKAEMIAYMKGKLEAIRPRLPRFFSRVPPYAIDVRRVPPANEIGAGAAFSEPPAPDGSRPGFVFVNLSSSTNWPRLRLPTTIFHEGLPGHQLDSGWSMSNAAVPLIRKSQQLSGYGEGWGLYAEQLADELGMYEGDPMGEIGYLHGALWRAHRCVVDTGMHHLHWSREKAVALFVDGQGDQPDAAEREIDRYAVSPGQACSYRLGYAVFNGLRESAKAKLGVKFDIRAFHDAMLANGRLPLDLLQARGERWMAAQA